MTKYFNLKTRFESFKFTFFKLISNFKFQILNSKNGFTLIEILIALAILVTILGLGLFISFDFYKSYSFHSEKSMLVSILQKARNQSLSNINQVKHGVHYGLGVSNCQLYDKCYVIFEGNSFVLGTATNIEIEASPAVTVTWPINDLVFNQLDGGLVNPAVITLMQNVKTATINTNSEGQIDWQ